MPKLQAARVTQCGLDFAVVLVDPKLFMNPSELEAFSERAQALFPGVPVAMLSYDDLKVKTLAKMPVALKLRCGASRLP